MKFLHFYQANIIINNKVNFKNYSQNAFICISFNLILVENVLANQENENTYSSLLLIN